MKFKHLKNLAYDFFPSLSEHVEANSLFNQIDLLFHNLVTAKNENVFLEISKNVNKLNNNPSAEKIYPNAMKELNNLVSLGKAIILNPKEYALLLDEELESVSLEIAKIENSVEQRELRHLFVLNCFNCACVSLFATLDDNLSEDEKQKQYLIQQTKLNIVLQNDIQKDNEANYWYSLHWFIRGNKNNATFYLKKMISQKSRLSLLTEDENMLWIKNKLPTEFLLFVKEESENVLNKK